MAHTSISGSFDKKACARAQAFLLLAVGASCPMTVGGQVVWLSGFEVSHPFTKKRAKGWGARDSGMRSN